ncbi:MAG: DNA-directed RNA polymerase subunit beta [Planctomycetes bacterium]|nr:DNA-directed RNA polymerase subunit beta [Planctomycetota bacterium]MCB9910356.1 DNA-directed RNA polymerase subunit beta [Planctomycetota bacterium]MCB9912033.1 DNA-directed RNA polymerase subunit beta [Planctomycetota bacterium]HPF13502.1 DNA-directed RNA polymerase subunit beta [Planctomycetota bacterium]
MTTKHGGRMVEPDAPVKQFGRVKEIVNLPDLVEIQTKAYDEFLAAEVPSSARTNQGLESLLRDVFPIYSYDRTMCLEYVGYELGRPRFEVDECRKLRTTYGYPFKVRLRLVKPEPIEEEVYLGELPIMLGGGEFIINGSERVIVSQLHRSPGVDFMLDTTSTDRELHSCWIIPERGSWVELNVSKKSLLSVRIDQSGKFSAMTFLRALHEDMGTDQALLRTFYPTKVVKKTKSMTQNAFAKAITDKIAVGDIVVLKTGEVLVPSATPIPETAALEIAAGDLAEVEVIDGDVQDLDMLIVNSLHEEPNIKSHEDALLKIYTRLRPGNPPQLEKARELFHEKFYDEQRYRLGRVGRFRLNRKFNQDIPEDTQVLKPEDIINSVKYLLELRDGRGEIDDIDNLGNRRVRTIAELAGEEFRKGLLKLRRTAQERMNLEEPDKVAPRGLINSKTFSSAVDYFFGRSELSQVVDQANPLSQLTHERRLSALGPGGLNRKRAGFDVRDVHLSHYGRLCPIETPEGANIGLISSLALYASLDDYGFLTAPYRKVKKGIVTDEIQFLRADEERGMVMAPADVEVDSKGKILTKRVLARRDGDNVEVAPENLDFVDVSPKQIIGVSAALIPFLEHDDANRALMGSNMQRQAVPLLIPEVPIVGTGMEKAVATNSSMPVFARKAGVVEYADSRVILVDDEEYHLTKFRGMNERTTQNHRPVVKVGDEVAKGQLLADGASTHGGELALGKNLLVAFMSWDGFNYEDAILVSERLVKDDVFTSVHIEEYEVEIRETKLGKEEFTRDIPNVGERALANLDDAGIVRVGTFVEAGDVLVGKVAPKSKSELTPEEKLLYAIFGKAGVDVKNASLTMPPGTRGVVIDAQKFSRRVNLTDEERIKALSVIRDAEMDFLRALRHYTTALLEKVNSLLGIKVVDDLTGKAFALDDTSTYDELRRVKVLCLAAAEEAEDLEKRRDAAQAIHDFKTKIDDKEAEKNKIVNRLSRGDELPTGVLEMVKVYVATKRNLSVGDKMAGRHGNKGVISKICPIEDMPYLEDGTPVDIVLNPLGVPSRMNVGQILETHLGIAAMHLGIRCYTPAFDGAREVEIENLLKEADLPQTGKFRLFDGRTGQSFEQEVTVGVMYMLKLHHLVDEKVHARATGPYSLITQQPLGGKARFGGQRFGEMEVWALEAYGAASILQEQLTVKSDDVDGRTKIYESMVKGLNILEPGTPVSFEVLTNEIRGLGLNMQLHKKVSETL